MGESLRHVVAVGPHITVRTNQHLEVVDYDLGIWRELARRGTRVTRVFGANTARVAEALTALSVGSLEVMPLRPRPSGPTALTRLRQLPKLLKSSQPDVVHCIGEPWHLGTTLTLRSAERAGVTCGVHFAENGPGLHGLGGTLRTIRARTALQCASYAVGWSANAAELAREAWQFPGRLGVFPAVGLPDALFSSPVVERGARASGVLFAGRLVPEKGVADVLKVARQLSPAGIRVLVAGDGPLRGMVEEAHREGAVRYLGSLSRRRLAKVMATAVVTLVPSQPGRMRGSLGTSLRWEEQFGLVIAESLAVGTPVVAYRSGAILETLGPGGRLRPVGDIDGLAEAIQDLLRNEADWLDLATRGRDWAKRFRCAEIAQRLTRLWDTVPT